MTCDITTGEPVMFSKNLLKFGERKLSLHKIVKGDPLDCYHSHYANSIRVILWGGYVEEVFQPEPRPTLGIYKRWTAGMIGVVNHELTHRIHRVIKGPSYSLWLRGKTRDKVYLRGAGWPDDLRDKGV